MGVKSKFSPEQQQEVLTYAASTTDMKAAVKYNVGVRTIVMWREKANTKLPDLAKLTKQLVESSGDLLTDVFNQTLSRLLILLPQANIAQTTIVLECVGSIKIAKEILNANQSRQNYQEGQWVAQVIPTIPTTAESRNYLENRLEQ